MFSLQQIAILFISISFISYGSSCLLSQAMKSEFERYRLQQLRVLTGLLQIFASVTLLIGLFVPVFALFAALFFSLMMLFAILVRIRIRDPWPLMIPAFFYMSLNIYLFLSLSLQFF